MKEFKCYNHIIKQQSLVKFLRSFPHCKLQNRAQPLFLSLACPSWILEKSFTNVKRKTHLSGQEAKRSEQGGNISQILALQEFSWKHDANQCIEKYKVSAKFQLPDTFLATMNLCQHHFDESSPVKFQGYVSQLKTLVLRIPHLWEV